MHPAIAERNGLHVTCACLEFLPRCVPQHFHAGLPSTLPLPVQGPGFLVSSEPFFAFNCVVTGWEDELNGWILRVQGQVNFHQQT